MITFIVILFMNPDQRPVMTSYEARYISHAHCMKETEIAINELQKNNYTKNATFSCVKKYNEK